MVVIIVERTGGFLTDAFVVLIAKLIWEIFAILPIVHRKGSKTLFGNKKEKR